MSVKYENILNCTMYLHLHGCRGDRSHLSSCMSAGSHTLKTQHTEEKDGASCTVVRHFTAFILKQIHRSTL